MFIGPACSRHRIWVIICLEARQRRHVATKVKAVCARWVGGEGRAGGVHELLCKERKGPRHTYRCERGGGHSALRRVSSCTGAVHFSRLSTHRTHRDVQRWFESFWGTADGDADRPAGGPPASSALSSASVAPVGEVEEGDHDCLKYGLPRECAVDFLNIQSPFTREDVFLIPLLRSFRLLRLCYWCYILEREWRARDSRWRRLGASLCSSEGRGEGPGQPPGGFHTLQDGPERLSRGPERARRMSKAPEKRF